ncbi:MAG TPA: SGNH/GDSL hydrolase family protein, partial [Kiritimatiellia bacterium]|nr:SGNH/GDSL hydrolase family protein [Kiritimatiellia bacterium]HMP96547.1 SGNH/GDSL hydrolase family protein [Kiritimatiellia bacterium]
MKQGPSKPDNGQDISRSRKRWFAFIAASLPFLVILAIETLLRSLGFGGHPPLCRRVTETPQGELYLVDVAKARSYFFANRDRPGYNYTDAFLLPKPEGSIRILMAGESALQGYPQPRNLASSSFLKAMLEDAWPGRTVEVLNLGTTAAASFPVMEMALEGARFDPDLVVIYTGHNEFFGAYGVASAHRAGSHPWMLKVHRWMYATAIVQALERVRTRGGPREDKTLMELMVGQGYTPARHWKRDAAARNLYRHVKAIADFYRSRHVPVMICTLPTNERDLAPLGEDRLEPSDADALSRALRQIASNPRQAKAALTDLLEKHPELARAHYGLGLIYDKEGAIEESRQHLVAARDLDTMPWRISTPLQEALIRAAGDSGALLCDVEAAFRANSPGGSIGWELMDDHVHPALEGQSLIARSIVESLSHLNGPLQVSSNAFANLAQRLAFYPECRRPNRLASA